MTTYKEKVKTPSELLAFAISSSVSTLDAFMHSGQSSFNGACLACVLGLAVGTAYSDIQAVKHLNAFTITEEQSDYLISDCKGSIMRHSVAGAFLPGATTLIAKNVNEYKNGNSNFL